MIYLHILVDHNLYYNYILNLYKMYEASSPDDEYATKIERIIGENTDLTRDLENWMTKLPHSLRSLPIIYLAIPGSHNSFTYNITSNSGVALDADKPLHYLKWLLCVKTVTARWTKTQNLTVTEQLRSGIRYFDLRFSTKKRDNDLYFCHGLYSGKVEPILKDIASFLGTHSYEVVILDCQHFYGFTIETHAKLMQMFIKIYGTKLLPYTHHMDYLSLDYMTTQFRYQLIVIYRSENERTGQNLFWPFHDFQTPWADTVQPNVLFSFLEEKINDREENRGLITQCVLTPQLSDILSNVFSTLKQKLAKDFEDQRTGWISKQRPGRGGVNIVIGDFVDLSDNLFTKSVINLNLKLLSDLPRRMNSTKGADISKRS